MKSYRLIAEDNESWTATVVESLPVGDKGVSTVELASSNHEDIMDAIDVLVAHGVNINDLIIALEELQKNEHNRASFGMQGGFLYTEFVGTVH